MKDRADSRAETDTGEPRAPDAGQIQWTGLGLHVTPHSDAPNQYWGSGKLQDMEYIL